MKVQLQNTLFYPATGGIENYLYHASKILLRMGHEPTILCSRHQPNLPAKEVYEGIKIIRHPYYHLPKPLFAFNLIYYEKSLQKFVKTNSKDIDAIWSRHPYCTYASCKALQEIPTIYIQATVWPSFLRYASEKLKGVRKIFFRVQNLQDYYIEKKAMEMCDKIVVLSKIRMREISDFYKFPKNKFEIVPPGIDLERFKPRERDKKLLNTSKISENAKIILTVCRLSPEKNVSMLIKAFAKLNIENTYLLIVGDGPNKLYLKQLAKELSINSKVKFLGFRKDIEKFYSIADVFILPSKYEGFGHVYLEAMASGVPCVGLRSDYPNIIVASEEIIRDGQTGYCADPYSIEDLAEKIEEIISNDELRYRMGRESREICEKEYSWEKHVQALIKIVDNTGRRH
ncbi:unnamed protein product [marine sediment metagenome]|uniref:Glycosyl transferase family 1 domain-containing protein n=1 Tax=marine sediment metagenome TaxID=412755 RepID=X0Z7W1_9ZZZZ